MQPATSPSIHRGSDDHLPPRRIAVIGGGISGLAAAHRLTELSPSAQVVLLEASGRLGGVLGTQQRDGYLIERSADMFTTREPWALDLCRRVGMADELIGTDGRFRQAYVVCRGKLLPVPDGFTLMGPAKIWPVLTTRLLSPLGKLRLARERFIPPRQEDGDESLKSFVVRRMGREVFDRLVQPLIGGIYTADPAKLSLKATLPQFLEMEKQYGSITRGTLQQHAAKNRIAKSNGNDRSKHVESGARYGMFLAPRLGMQQMVDAIAAKLPVGCVQFNSAVEKLERDSAGWRVALRGVEGYQTFDDVIVASPAYAGPTLLKSVDQELASLIGSIPHAGCSVAVLGYRREQIKHPLNLFGAVAPAIEKRRIIAASLASVKFAGRAPEGRVLLRLFVGGALQPELAALPDQKLEALVREELADLLGVQGEPDFCQIQRWLGTMPQYHVGHLDLVAKIEQQVATLPNFELAGNAYRGVGIPFCIRSGELAAERIVAAWANSGSGTAVGVSSAESASLHSESGG
jgi:oxygen-dependent protoporphyrinogen oxidase